MVLSKSWTGLVQLKLVSFGKGEVGRFNRKLVFESYE